MKRGPSVRGKKKNIYVRGLGLIEVRETKLGDITDADGNFYARRGDGSFENISEKNEDLVEVDLNSLKPYQEVTIKDGTTWRNQPNQDGKFNLVLVARPKAYVTLSPNQPSRYGKHSK